MEQKSPGVYRLAVLGDSFIWGDGLPESQIWSRKLERMLAAACPGRVEVMSWGRRGWSTLDQYHFLRQHGVRYHPDLVIIGFVSNDPDLGNYPQRYFKVNQVSLVRPLRRWFPDALDFIGDRSETLLSRIVDVGYANWEGKLYSAENLAKYAELWLEVRNFCLARDLPLLVVHTPPNCEPYYQEKFKKVASRLEALNIPYLDLYPALVRDLGHLPPRRLWANPANPHPGDLVTQVYAREVCRHLTMPPGSVLLKVGASSP